MENKIKITIDGQSFEIPVDASLLTGLFGNMGMMGNGLLRQRRFNVPMAMPRAEIQTSHERIGPRVGQSSHERMEETFFDQFRSDLVVCKQNNLRSKDERILAALIALHKRVKWLERQVIIRKPILRMTREALQATGKKEEQPTKKVKPKKPTKAKNRTNVQTKAVPKAKGKSTKLTKK